MNLQEQTYRIKQIMNIIDEGLNDTSWSNKDGDKITLKDLLKATEDIPVKNFSVKKLKKHLLTWENDDNEISKIDKADLKYPILVFVNDKGSIITIIDGHHRIHKAIRNKMKTIKAKLIPLNNLPNRIRKIF